MRLMHSRRSSLFGLISHFRLATAAFRAQIRALVDVALNG